MLIPFPAALAAEAYGSAKLTSYLDQGTPIQQYNHAVFCGFFPLIEAEQYVLTRKATGSISHHRHVASSI